MCAKHFLSQPPAAEDMCHHCAFRVLNGCIWERKGAFGTGKGAKTAKRKIGEHLVLNLDVKMRHAVDEGPKRGQNKNSR